jgi:hypothetical protein
MYAIATIAVSMASCSRLQAISALPPVPHQPSESFVYPKRTFGKKIVSASLVQAVDLDEANDLAYCHICVSALMHAEPSFISSGYSNWKDATVAFKKHQLSACHHTAVKCYDNCSIHYKRCWRATVTDTSPGKGHE